MTERVSNKEYWRRIALAKQTRIQKFSKKYGVSVKQALLELQLRDVLEKEDRQFLIDEGLRYDSKAVFSRCEEE